MKSFFKRSLVLLGRRWVWTLLLTLAVALLVWFGGPLLAIAEYKPWEGPTARLASISALCLAWGAQVVFHNWRAATGRLNTQGNPDEQGRLRQLAAVGEARQVVRARFKAALRSLKTSSLYDGRGVQWRSELPWYLLIGPRDSGKTSLLDFSGVEFPLQASPRTLGQAVGSTEHCDWYFAENGVLIDTSGRYLEQPDAAIDSAAWRALLAMLRSRRRARPLNGVLLSVPVPLLQSADRAATVALGRTLRSRLQDIREALRINVPVYLVLTKADHLPGFDSFFDQLSREESEQVLGVSFTGDQQGSDPGTLNHEFEALLERLNAQVIQRMHQERDIGRRGEILTFPAQLADLSINLGYLVDATFTGNRYQPGFRLRGFYFTSAPHQGSAAASLGQSPALAQGYTGRSRFIHDLLVRVIFPEAQLAGLNVREARRITWGQRGLYAAALGCLVVFGAAWARSFSDNDRRLETLRGLAQEHHRAQGAQAPMDDASAVLAVLDTRYAATQVFSGQGGMALAEQGGLYQGQPSNPALLQAYERELTGHLLPRVARMLEAQIHATLDNRDQLLDALGAYLMLDLEERRDTALLKARLAAAWSRQYPGLTDVQNSLNGHFERLLQRPVKYPLDGELVRRARQVLRQEPLTAVVYKALRAQARALPDYRLGEHLGSGGGALAGTDYPIPGFYTQHGYQQYFIAHGASLVSNILRDNWILGEGSSLSVMDTRRLMVELEQRYFADYANYWGEAVGRVSLHPVGEARQGAEQVAQLSAANSPVLLLLSQVREQTRFPALPDADLPAKAADTPIVPAKATTVAGLAAAAVGGASQVLPKLAPGSARQLLERRFEPLHHLLDEQGAPTAGLVPVLAALNDLHGQLADLARASQPEQLGYDMARRRMAAGPRDALGVLHGAGARLPHPLGGWFGGLADDSWRLTLDYAAQHINQHYQTELYGFYESAIRERYPFHAHSDADVALNDFREFFKAQGLIDRFFDSYLKPFVASEAGTYSLRSLDARSLPISRGFLEQLNNARIIRRGFFAENPEEPQVRFRLEPHTLDPAVSRAAFRFGDQHMVYRHGPVVPTAFEWPAAAAGGRSSLVLEQLDGRAQGLEKNNGPWSLFRLLDLMETQYQQGRDVLMVKADIGGMRANYLLLSQRSPNPFDMTAVRRFRMPVAL